MGHSFMQKYILLACITFADVLKNIQHPLNQSRLVERYDQIRKNNWRSLLGNRASVKQSSSEETYSQICINKQAQLSEH